MTNARWFNDLITAEWGNENDEFSTDLDRPSIVTEGADGRRDRSQHVRDQPVIFVQDGGRPMFNAASIGYRERHVEAKLQLDIETTFGRDHLIGTVDETYGGLSGEVQRIMDKYRRGMQNNPPVPDPGYDILLFEQFDDQIAQRGADRWGGVWTVIFITFAGKIAQDPAR